MSHLICIPRKGCGGSRCGEASGCWPAADEDWWRRERSEGAEQRRVVKCRQVVVDCRLLRLVTEDELEAFAKELAGV